MFVNRQVGVAVTCQQLPRLVMGGKQTVLWPLPLELTRRTCSSNIKPGLAVDHNLAEQIWLYNPEICSQTAKSTSQMYQLSIEYAENL